jgi:hypothetical protein
VHNAGGKESEAESTSSIGSSLGACAPRLLGPQSDHGTSLSLLRRFPAHGQSYKHGVWGGWLICSCASHLVADTTSPRLGNLLW